MINTLTFLLICSEEEGVTVILSILGTYAFLRKGVVGVIICSVKAKVKLAVIGVLGVIAAALITMIIWLPVWNIPYRQGKMSRESLFSSSSDGRFRSSRFQWKKW